MWLMIPVDLTDFYFISSGFIFVCSIFFDRSSSLTFTAGTFWGAWPWPGNLTTVSSIYSARQNIKSIYQFRNKRTKCTHLEENNKLALVALLRLNNCPGLLGFAECVRQSESATGNKIACQGVNNILSCVTDWFQGKTPRRLADVRQYYLLSPERRSWNRRTLWGKNTRLKALFSEAVKKIKSLDFMMN